MTRATFTLDAEAKRSVEALSRRWGVSSSAAVRRALVEANRNRGPNLKAMHALEELGKTKLTKGQLERWEEEILAERSAGRL